MKILLGRAFFRRTSLPTHTSRSVANAGAAANLYMTMHEIVRQQATHHYHRLRSAAAVRPAPPPFFRRNYCSSHVLRHLVLSLQLLLLAHVLVLPLLAGELLVLPQPFHIHVFALHRAWGERHRACVCRKRLGEIGCCPSASPLHAHLDLDEPRTSK